jgi:hypothetical protein
VSTLTGRKWVFATGRNFKEITSTVATTQTKLADPYWAVLRGSLFNSPIDRLRNQRKPDTKPKKAKPVTDEQLLAIVDELSAKIEAQAEALRIARKENEELRDHIRANYRLKWFAPIKQLPPSYTDFLTRD